MLRSGELLTEKHMPHDKNVFEGACPEIDEDIIIEHQGRPMRVKVGWWSKRNQNAHCMPNMYHIRVEEI
jgi:hypothetical protein